MDEKKIKTVEEYLNHCGELYFHTFNREVKERNRGCCEAVGFMLSLFGYDIEWKNEKASVVKVD